MGKSHEPMTTIHISTLSSMMWNSLMAKSKEYAANLIGENMLTQVDSDGMSTTLMEAIVDH